MSSRRWSWTCAHCWETVEADTERELIELFAEHADTCLGR
jgi:hypothetical protein